MRVIKSILIGLFFSLLIIISTSFIISFIYEDEVSELFLKELNKRVRADFRAKEVNLSLLRRFPNATIELRSFELYAAPESSKDKKGSLSFTADHVYLQFDIVDIFMNNYKLEKVYIKQSQFNYTPNGEKPLITYRDRTSPNIEFDIEQMVFDDLYYSVLNQQQAFFLEGHSSRTVLNGNLGLDEFNLDIDSRSLVKELSIDEFNYARQKEVRLRMNLLVTPEAFRVRSGMCYFERIPFIVEGQFNRDKQYIDIDLKGTDLKIDDLQLYVPWKLKRKLKSVTVDRGKLDFYARIEGPVNEGKPNLEADFSLAGSQVEIDASQAFRFRNIALNGYVSNGRNKDAASSQLSLSNIHAELGNNVLNGNLKIKNFAEPQVVSEGSMSLHLKGLSERFRKKHDFEGVTGQVELNYKYSDALKALSRLTESLHFSNLTMDATLQGVNARSPSYDLQNINGFIYLKRDLYLDSMRLRFNGNDLVLDGKIFNIYRNLRDSTQPFRFQGALYSKHIDLKRLFEPPASSSDSLIRFQFPEKLRGNLRFAADRVSLQRFEAKRVAGDLRFGNRLLELTDTEFNAFQGKAYAQAELKAKAHSSTDLLFDSRFYLDRVNIRRVFTSFSNFGQDYITARNLKGFLSGEIAFSSGMNENLKIQQKTVNNSSDIQIEQGELIDFEPLLSMSNFVKLDELRHVTFSRLSNKISIEDQTVWIPEMEIKSSSYDIHVSGYHTFNNRFSYDVRLLLSQILSRKARQRKDPDSEFGNIQEDGVGQSRLYLKIHGTPDKYAIEYDKEGVREKIREDIKEEKQELRQILNEEFGWFREDTALQEGEAGAGDPQKKFNIQWEDQEDQTEQEKGRDTTGRKDPGFIIKFEEDTLK